jgi:hypothetical protein
MRRFLLLVVLVLLSGCLQQNPPVACPADAKICPDGTAVGRVPPDCEFAPCPTLNCTSYSPEHCPQECVICPPCEVCSSVSCQSEEFCAGLGFDRNWSRRVGVSGPSGP